MCGADWGVAEIGATGPSFHPAAGGVSSGFTIIAVIGPPRGGTEDGDGGGKAGDGDGDGAERVWVRMCETGHAFREENMWQFAAAAGDLCKRCVEDDAFLADNERDDIADGWRAVVNQAVEGVCE